MKRSVPIILCAAGLVVALLAGSDNALARPLLQGGAPTVVSYQGQVRIGGRPYSGTGYFKFAVVGAGGATSLWSNDGTSAGGSEPAAAVSLPVANGLFTVLLGDTSLAGMTQPLGATVFGGTERYLRVWFSRDGAAYTLLIPDRRIAAVPYALQAQEAVNADTLDGKHAADLAYTAGAGLELSGNQFRVKGSGYQNVIVVAKSGGDFTSIQAALDSITDASADNRYLVWVAPGVYNERVTMRPFVDIEGAGEQATRITSGGSGYVSTGTVMGANDAELRDLAVENTGGNTYAIAVVNNGSSPRLTRVTASASGSYNNTAVHNFSSSAKMTGVTASASGGTFSHGVFNDACSPAMTIADVTATASGSSYNYGVYNLTSSPVMTRVSATASGGSNNYGVYNDNNASPTMTDVAATASGGRDNNYGVYNDDNASPEMTSVTIKAMGGARTFGVFNYSGSSATMTQVTVSASEASNANYGVHNGSDASLVMTDCLVTTSGGRYTRGVVTEYASATIRQSIIRAGAASSDSCAILIGDSPIARTVRVDHSLAEGIHASIRSGSGYIINVGASQLIGALAKGAGSTFNCFGNYDGNWSAVFCP